MHYSSICNVALVSVLLLGCSSTIRNYDIERARSSRQSVQRQSEESKILEDALQGQPKAFVAMLRKHIQLNQERLRLLKDYASILNTNYGTGDKAMMKLGAPTKQFEGDNINVLQYEWSTCVCSAILSYDKTSKKLVNSEFFTCNFHGPERFGISSANSILITTINSECNKIGEIITKNSENKTFLLGLHDSEFSGEADKLLSEDMLITEEILKINDEILAMQGGKSED